MKLASAKSSFDRKAEIVDTGDGTLVTRKSLLKQSGKQVVDDGEASIDNAKDAVKGTASEERVINPPSHRSRRTLAVGRWRLHELRMALITPIVVHEVLRGGAKPTEGVVPMRHWTAASADP
jgi:hypothetical protein